MRRGSEYVFSRVPTADIPRSSFNRSHTHKTTLNGGFLVPVFVDEVLPGDTFVLNMSCFARLATPVVPIMDNMYMDCFFFFVPNRLVWSNWQKFMGEQEDPGDSTDYRIPKIICPAGGWQVGSLADYFGLPVGKGATLQWASALPFRAYNLIFNEWFRDENLINSLVVQKDDGPDDTTVDVNGWPMRRGKRHDYFTSCLPWPQKGPSVETPIGGSAPISGTGLAGNEPVRMVYTSSVGVGDMITAPAGGFAEVRMAGANNPVANENLYFSAERQGLVADLSEATSVTINQLRLAFQVQKLLERDARGGTRYTEILRAHFGVVSPDARLQRPEYLGGGTVPVNINPVAQTSGTPQTLGELSLTPQGNLAAYGTAGGSGIGFTKSFVEHGYIIGIVEVRAELSYQQGLHRMWSRETKHDFYWPALAHLGEQDVKSKEIYFDGLNNGDDEAVFGYQERWAEYRYFPSKITGKFRSNITGSLDVWHLAQDFDARPLLNDSFISDTPPIECVIAVTTEPHFLFDSHFAIKCVRPMPTYSVPGYIDHF